MSIFQDSLTGVSDSFNEEVKCDDAIEYSLSQLPKVSSQSRYIPKEIWGEIFFHCLSTDRNPIISYEEAPLLLTHVSAAWKDIALSTPNLWTRISIFLTEQPRKRINAQSLSNPSAEDSRISCAIYLEDRQRYSALVATQCTRIAQWLRLAGSLPLKINLFSHHTVSIPAEYDWLRVIFSFSRQFERLDFDLLMNATDVNFAIHSDQLPKLESLFVRQAHRKWLAETTSLFYAPNLRDLAIGNFPFDYFSLPATWANLQHLVIHCLIDGATTLKLLAHCKCLVDCSLVVGWCREQDLNNMNTEGIFCPCLEYLTICDPGAGDSPNSLFQALYPPNLRYFKWIIDTTAQNLRFVALQWHRGHNDVESSNESEASTSFLPQLNKLETLAIKPNDLSSHKIVHLLHSVPHVTTLIVGDKPENRQRPWPGLGDNPLSSCFLTPPEPGRDVLDVLSTRQRINPSSDPVFLLPNLENIECYGTISPDDILNVILARTTLDSLRDPVPFSRLKQFRAQLDVSTAEKDKLETLSFRVKDRVRRLGIPFRLDIIYYENESAIKVPEKIVFDSQHADIISGIRGFQ